MHILSLYQTCQNMPRYSSKLGSDSDLSGYCSGKLSDVACVILGHAILGHAILGRAILV